MAIKFTGNVEFKGKQAFEVRAEYATLVAMKSADERGLNDGLIAFNKETNKHYTFHGSNTVDNTTGKWRELLVEASKVEAKIDEKIQAIPATDLSAYALKTEIKKTTVESSGLTHTIKYGEEVVGTINVPKDLFIQNFEYVADQKKLKITVNDATNSGVAKVTEVSVADFVQTYTASTGVELVGSNFQLTSEYTALPAKVTTLEGKVATLEGKVVPVTTSTPGLMSAEDKTKLDGLSDYVLPEATDNVLGGIKLGFTQADRKYPVMLEGGKAYVEVPATETALNQRIFIKTQSEFEQLEQGGHLVADAIYFIKG